ncbi:MAG: DNA polymerase subunit gamma and tau [Osedax symbiont Rs1]|nr:MAG: DNA polymerase subunit gamma and tau [Osedax symbiont Rs1]
MSYQVLARKWRPKQFTEMVGQGHVLKALVNALDDNRLHHAYLFTGTRGVGKTSIARLFAKALNCEQGISSTPCGQCSACTEIAEGRFVDLIEVDAASRTKVEDTRELLENVQYAPSRGRFKVYLIDEVHMLSKSSFNALLKTLEEPPPHVKFLLATTDPQKLPVTVLSRCLQFNLKNMIPQRIVEHLNTVLSAEQIPFEEPALWLLARSADGSMRDALSLTDQSIAFGAGSVNEADVRVMLGSIDLRLVHHLLSALVNSDGAALLKHVQDLAQFSPDYHTVLGDIVSLLHRIAIAQTVPSALDNSMGDQQQILELAGQLSAEDVQLFYQIALMGRKDLPFVPDAREGLEMTLLRMLAFRPAQSSHTATIAPLAATENSAIAAPETAAPAVAAIQADSIVSSAVNSGVAEQQVEQAAAPALADATVLAEKKSLASSTADIQPRVDPSANHAFEQPFVNSESAAPRVVESVAAPVVDALASNHVEHPPANVQGVENSQAAVTLTESSVVNSGSEQVPAAIVQDKLSESAKNTAPDVSGEPVVAPPSAVVEQMAGSQRKVPVDIPPWEEDNSQVNQPLKTSSKPTAAVSARAPVAARAELKAVESTVEAPTNQINITHMLDAPVTEYSQLSLDAWPALVSAIGFTGMTAHIAENLSLESIQGSNIEFNVSQVQKNVLDQTQKNRIQSMLSQYFGCELNIAYDSERSTRETPWQCFEKLRATRLRQAISSFQTDEMVQQLVAMFGAEIDRSSIMPVG